MSIVRFFNDGAIIDRAVTRYSVGFVDQATDPPSPLGSGTFLRFGKVSGILTCGHVIEVLNKSARRDGKVGIINFAARTDALQHMRIHVDAASTISLGESPWTKDRPDIGFVKLSPNEVASLSAQVSCLNGDEQARVAIGNVAPRSHSFSVDYISGVIAEWTKTEELAGRTRRIVFNGFANGGQISSVNRNGGFDYLTFSPESEPGLTPPESYGGTSGGGLWRLYLDEANGSLALSEHRLMGVAFYQMDQQIVAHGPSAIYHRLRRAIESQFGE